MLINIYKNSTALLGIETESVEEDGNGYWR